MIEYEWIAGNKDLSQIGPTNFKLMYTTPATFLFTLQPITQPENGELIVIHFFQNMARLVAPQVRLLVVGEFSFEEPYCGN